MWALTNDLVDFYVDVAVDGCGKWWLHLHGYKVKDFSADS